jgi:hypothetical protein
LRLFVLVSDTAGWAKAWFFIKLAGELYGRKRVKFSRTSR